MRHSICIAILLSLASGAAAAQSPDILVDRLLGNARVLRVLEQIDEDRLNIISDTAALEQPANAAAYVELLQARRLSGAHIDTAGNVTASWTTSPDQPILVIGAHLADARALAVQLAVIRALQAESLTTSYGIVLLGAADRHGEEGGAGLRTFFEENEFKDRFRSFLMLEGREADRVSIGPKTIGSNIVQLALEVINRLGNKPYYEENLIDREIALERRIQAVTIGCGYTTSKGVQIAAALALAIAGLE